MAPRIALRPLAFAALIACSSPARPPPEAAKSEAEREAARPKIEPGVRAPGFSLRSVADGSPVTLEPGKVTILVFWATWSEPDKKELIMLQEIYVRHANAGLKVVALSVDEDDKQLAAFAREYKLTFPIAWDAQHKIAEVYRPSTDPATYVIDGKGIVRFHHDGFHAGEDDDIERNAMSLLGPAR